MRASLRYRGQLFEFGTQQHFPLPASPQHLSRSLYACLHSFNYSCIWETFIEHLYWNMQDTEPDTWGTTVNKVERWWLERADSLVGEKEEKPSEIIMGCHKCHGVKKKKSSIAREGRLEGGGSLSHQGRPLQSKHLCWEFQERRSQPDKRKWEEPCR